MAFAAARMILKDKRRKSKEDFVPPRQRSKVDDKHKTHFSIPFDIIASIVLCRAHTHTFPFDIFLTKTYEGDGF